MNKPLLLPADGIHRRGWYFGFHQPKLIDDIGPGKTNELLRHKPIFNEKVLRGKDKILDNLWITIGKVCISP